MQVQEVLAKITDRNAPVIGCIARSGDQIHHNLEDFGLDCSGIADAIDDLLVVSNYLDDGEAQIDRVWTEYDGHCLIGQRYEDYLLVAVTDHLERAGFKKLQVGLSLQSRLLKKALDESGSVEPQASPEPTPAPVVTPEDVADPKTVTAKKSSFLSNIMQAAIGQAPEGPATPPNPDTKGKVRKMYRGQVYWE